MLYITMEFRHGILFVRLRGTLNKDNVCKLHKRVNSVIKNNGIRNVVFNLSNLKSIDLKGINSLFYGYELCHNNDGTSLIISNSNIDTTLKRQHVYNYFTEIKNEIMAVDVIK